MEICTLASGSKGNVSLVRAAKARFLVDVGISAKRIRESLALLGESPENITAIFLTHEHRDHISGLKTFLKQYPIPVFSSAGTFDALLQTSGFEGLNKELLHSIKQEEAFQIEGLQVSAFPIPHDAFEPFAYTFLKEEKKVAVCTDVGMITDCIKENLKGCSAMILEANHDEHILQAGRYPYPLKKRILGNTGHLSNENSGKLLADVWHEKLKHVILGHLSEENNLPELALLSVRYELLEKWKEFEQFTKLSVASKDTPSQLIQV